jgi:hypothetical protein
VPRAGAPQKPDCLEELGLHNTRIPDAGVVHVEGLTELNQLGICGTQVTNEGVKTFQQALPTCRFSHRFLPLIERLSQNPVRCEARRETTVFLE